MERKTLAFELTNADSAATEGVIKGYAAVMGNIDSGDDRIVFGAFQKTISENGNRIKVGWQHGLDYPLGRTTVIREVSRDELPQKILERAPDATGGLYVEGKVSMTQTNMDRLQLIKDGVVDELSIGYAPVQERFVKAGGKTVRELLELKLYEWSPVTLAMNAAAQTTDVKRADAAKEQPVKLIEIKRGHPGMLLKGESCSYIQQRLSDALEAAYPQQATYDPYGYPMYSNNDGPGCCIVDVYPGSVVVYDQDFDALWQIPFTMDANDVVTLGTPALVKVVYQPVGGGAIETGHISGGSEGAGADLSGMESKAGRRNSTSDAAVLRSCIEQLTTLLGEEEEEKEPDNDGGKSANLDLRGRLAVHEAAALHLRALSIN